MNVGEASQWLSPGALQHLQVGWKTLAFEISHRSPFTDFFHNYSCTCICTNILPSWYYMNYPCSCPKPTSSLTHRIPFLSCPQRHHSSDYLSPFRKFRFHFFIRPFPSRYKFLKKNKAPLHPISPFSYCPFYVSSKATFLKTVKVATINSSSSVSWTYSSLIFDLKTPPKLPLKSSTLLGNQTQQYIKRITCHDQVGFILGLTLGL